MIAVDTNVLVAAHRRSAPDHERARATMEDLANGRAPWAIPWPCIHEFVAVATHPRVFSPPSSLGEATAQIDAWLAAPSVVTIGEADDHWPRLRRLLVAGSVIGPRVHDGRVAAICLAHGVREFLSADRDFGRFPELIVRNPFVSRRPETRPAETTGPPARRARPGSSPRARRRG